jgi:hypothetical protein
MQHMVPSKRFVELLKLHREPAYRLAWRAGVHPNTLSKLVSGYLRPRVNDPRICAVGRELGLTPEECFEMEPEQQVSGPPLEERVSA